MTPAPIPTPLLYDAFFAFSFLHLIDSSFSRWLQFNSPNLYDYPHQTPTLPTGQLFLPRKALLLQAYQNQEERKKREEI